MKSNIENVENVVYNEAVEYVFINYDIKSIWRLYMKRSNCKKIVCLLLVTVLATLSFTGCGNYRNKKETTIDKFTEVMKEMNYTVQDATDQMSDTDSIDSVTVAFNDDYQIELYIFKSAKQAKEGYNNIKKTIQDEKARASKTSYKTISLRNYNFYKLTADDTYYVDYRIGKTVIYVNQNKEYKDDIDKALKKLGYN